MKIPKARKLQSGKWFIQLRINGKSISHTGETEEAVNTWARSYKGTYCNRAKQQSEYDRILKGIAKADEEIKIEKRVLPTVAAELELIDEMDGLAFERYAVDLFQMTGFFNGGNVYRTKGSCDYGADLIIECLDGNRVSVQCKRMKGKVGIRSIQEVVASKKYYRTQAAGVLTNSYFTSAAKELAHENGVALFDRKQLIKLIKMKIQTLDEVWNRNQWADLLRELNLVSNLSQ